jgi:Bacterial Ig domain
MRRRAVALALVLALLPVPAQAAPLSATEKAEIGKLMHGLVIMGTSWRAVGDATAFTTTASRAALRDVLAGMIAIETDLWRGYALILHVNPAAPGDTATFAAYEALPRASWVAEGKTKINAAIAGITATQALIDTATAIGGQAAGYYTVLGSAKSHLTTTNNDISGFNQSLTYLGPRDTPWFPQIVSPHGDWVKATRLIFAALNRVLLASTQMKLVFDAQAQGEAEMPTSTNSAFNLFLSNSGTLINKYPRVLGSWTNVPDPVHCQFSPHHFMGRMLEHLTQIGSESNSQTTPHKGGEISGAPYLFDMAAIFGSGLQVPLRVPLETRPLTWVKYNNALGHWFEAWQAQDGAVWEIMAFPQGVTIDQLRTQSGRTNDSNIPPVCPDVNTPTVAVDYPANGQTVQGRQTIQTSCVDTIMTTAQAASMSGSGYGATVGVFCNKVEIKIDGVIRATVTSLPYDYAWNTSAESNGSHTIQVVGYDAAGNSTASSTITVTVAGGV